MNASCLWCVNVLMNDGTFSVHRHCLIGFMCLLWVIRIHESVDILRDDGDVVVFYVLSK